jgi:hypothetical protein
MALPKCPPVSNMAQMLHCDICETEWNALLSSGCPFCRLHRALATKGKLVARGWACEVRQGDWPVYVHRMAQCRKCRRVEVREVKP